MLHLEIKRRQLTIGQVMIAIAVCAVSLASPKFLLFAFAFIFWWFIIFGVLFSRTGRRVAEWCTLAVVILVLLALFSNMRS
jgi:hypothetical protein